MMKTPTDAELSCLNSWPGGTNGYIQETELIHDLNELCKKHGYGRVPQVAQAINEIWNNPDEISKWLDYREKRLKLLAECRKEIKE